MRYDAAIIGAGVEGLTAAALLGRAGLRVLVVDKNERVGGRAIVREFHPGFRVCPYLDDVAPIPREIFWDLDLARRGAIPAPRRESLAVWPGRSRCLPPTSDGDDFVSRLFSDARRTRQEIVSRVFDDASHLRPRRFFRRTGSRRWPGSKWSGQSFVNAVVPSDADDAAHLASLAFANAIAGPELAGSALQIPRLDSQGVHFAGGMGTLVGALESAARDTGVAFTLGIEATDIREHKRRIVGLGLADGSEIAVSRIISTLDLKRTFLGFFAWNTLPPSVIRRVSAFRLAGSVARVVFALEALPKRPAGTADGAIQVAPSIEGITETFHAWRNGLLSAHLPLTLRIVSSSDPRLAPHPGAVVTATFTGVPFRLFDGAWTHEKREILRARATASAEAIIPGFSSRILATEVLIPLDFENALGATEGDLFGGELAADQMLGEDFWENCALPRTPLEGLYLAGSYLAAGAFATCAAGAAAARALIADQRRRFVRGPAT